MEQISEEQIAEAARVIKSGGVVVYPTETAYGLGVDATNPIALAKLYTLKAMPTRKPTHVCLRSIDEADKYAHVDERARKLAAAFMPGPLTLILPTRGVLPEILEKSAAGTFGFRVPKHAGIMSLLELLDVPITATSANRHMSPTPYSVAGIKDSFGDDFAKIDYVLDAGPIPEVLPSTILSLMTPEPKILRQGPIGLAEVLAILQPSN